VDTIVSARLDANADQGRRRTQRSVVEAMEGLDAATGEEQHGIIGGVLEQVHDAILGSLTRARVAPLALPAHEAAVVRAGSGPAARTAGT
jgi:hypothetical protein